MLDFLIMSDDTSPDISVLKLRSSSFFETQAQAGQSVPVKCGCCSASFGTSLKD